MVLFDPNSPLFLGVLITADIIVAIAITPRFVMWHIKRKLPSLLDEISEDKVLFDKIRAKFMGGIFGAFGGRPPSWGTLAKMGVMHGVSQMLEKGGTNPLGTLNKALSVTKAVKDTAEKTT